jgi:hypothetical protein
LGFWCSEKWIFVPSVLADKLLNSFLTGQTIARRWGMQAIRAVRRVYHLHLQEEVKVTFFTLDIAGQKRFYYCI